MKQSHILLAGSLAVCCTSSFAYAQTISAGVNGTVTDAAGAVIPNAKVTVTNTATNVSTSTVTTRDGVYVIRNLQIGQYKLAIESAGFTTQSLGPFTLETWRRGRQHQRAGDWRSRSSVEYRESDAWRYLGH
jgi:hypothetical protein